MNKHLIWAITIISIVAMICGTLIYLNYNAWVLRFEMDDNTKEAIKSIEYPMVDIETNENNFPNISIGNRIPCDCNGCYAICYNITVIDDANVLEGGK